MNAILYLIVTLIDVYQFILIAAVILSWLINFNVINTHNQFVDMLAQVLFRLTEPVLAPVRNFLPPMGGIDLSPIVVLILLQVLKVLVVQDIAPALGVY